MRELILTGSFFCRNDEHNVVYQIDKTDNGLAVLRCDNYRENEPNTFKHEGYLWRPEKKRVMLVKVEAVGETELISVPYDAFNLV